MHHCQPSEGYDVESETHDDRMDVDEEDGPEAVCTQFMLGHTQI